MRIPFLIQNIFPLIFWCFTHNPALQSHDNIQLIQLCLEGRCVPLLGHRNCLLLVDAVGDDAAVVDVIVIRFSLPVSFSHILRRALVRISLNFTI